MLIHRSSPFAISRYSGKRSNHGGVLRLAAELERNRLQQKAARFEFDGNKSSFLSVRPFVVYSSYSQSVKSTSQYFGFFDLTALCRVHLKAKTILSIAFP